MRGNHFLVFYSFQFYQTVSLSACKCYINANGTTAKQPVSKNIHVKQSTSVVLLTEFLAVLENASGIIWWLLVAHQFLLHRAPLVCSSVATSDWTYSYRSTWGTHCIWSVGSGLRYTHGVARQERVTWWEKHVVIGWGTVSNTPVLRTGSAQTTKLDPVLKYDWIVCGRWLPSVEEWLDGQNRDRGNRLSYPKNKVDVRALHHTINTCFSFVFYIPWNTLGYHPGHRPTIARCYSLSSFGILAWIINHMFNIKKFTW